MNILELILTFIKKYWKEILIVGTIILLFILFQKVSALKEENSRLSSNYYAMCDSAKVYKTKSGKLATQTKNMELTVKELEALYGDAKSEIKDLNIKIKKLEQFQRGVVEKEIHDTITLHDTLIDNTLYKTGVFCEPCTELTFTVSNESASFDLISKDNIDILISIQKEGKWYQFWKWPRKKDYVTTAVSSCPNTTVTINSCKIKK